MAQDKKTKKAINSELNKMMRNDIEVIEAYFVNHWKMIVAAGVAIILLIALALGLNQQMENREYQGRVALNSAITIETLEKALNDYPNSPSAETAGFRLAKLHAEAKDSVKCSAALNKALTLVAADQVLDRRMDAVGILEVVGDVAQAQAILQGVLPEPALTVRQRAQALYTLGRLATNRADKIQYFNEVVGISSGDENTVFYILLSKTALSELNPSK